MSAGRADQRRLVPGSGPGISRTVVAGLCRSVFSCSCDLAPFPGCDRLDETGLDELAECGFGDAHVSADPAEADASLFDQPSREPYGGAEYVGRLGDGQGGTATRRRWLGVSAALRLRRHAAHA